MDRGLDEPTQEACVGSSGGRGGSGADGSSWASVIQMAFFSFSWPLFPHFLH